jgi:exopolysaccharide production protein ExoZ
MQRLDGLQALRGVAATMVVVDHAMRAAILQGHAFVGLEDFAGTVGRMGVNIFFILSGFIMTYTTRDTAALPPAVRARTFVSRRVLRLVPLYWLATAVTLVVGTLEGTRYRVAGIVTSLLFLPNMADADDWRMPPVVGVGWTLNYESLFYAIFALSLVFPRRLALGLCVAAIAVLVGGGSWAARHVGTEPWHRLLAFYSFRNIGFFATGIVLAVALRVVPASRSAWSLRAALALIAAALATYLVLGLANGSTRWAALSAFTCTTTVALAACSAHLRPTAIRRTLLHLGDASFSIYLFHALIVDRLAATIGTEMTASRGGLFVAATTVSCLMLGSAIHSAVEAPLGKKLRGLFDHRSDPGRTVFRRHDHSRVGSF